MLGAPAGLSLLAVLLAGNVAAANDWDVACNGTCTYDLPDGGASIYLSGASNAVSDLTTAGGWTTLSCKSTTNTQTIRTVCQSEACEHIFEGQGAVDTVVRLPETCGTAPFARIVNATVDPDQSIPAGANVSSSQAGSTIGTVYLIGIDVDFAAVNPQVTGPVSFQMSTNSSDGPVTRRAITLTPGSTVTLPAIIVDETFPLSSESIACDGFNASVSTQFGIHVNASVTLGLNIGGTVIPSNVSQFSVSAGLDGSIIGTLGVQTTASGTFSTGKIALFTVPIAGYDIPGIFSLGPSFTIYGQADLQLGSELDVELDLAYNISGAHTSVPTQKIAPGVTPANSNFKLSVVPGLEANATVTASLIPELDIGFDVFSGLASAGVYLNLEADAIIGLSNFDASSGSQVTGNNTSGQVSGCIDIDSGFSVNVGADGSLFNFISGGVNYALYNQTWDLYDQCFSSAASSVRRQDAIIEAAPTKSLERRDSLFCPENLLALERIISQVLKAVGGGKSGRSSVDVAELSWGKHTHMVYAFAETTSQPDNITVDAGSLKRFVASARVHNVSPLLAIGGWTSSRYFFSAVESMHSRAAFAFAILGLVKTHDLNGIDFECSGSEGIGSNFVSPSDSDSFLLLLQELRAKSDSLQLTAAVGMTPFSGSDGAPMRDVLEFAKVLDRIELMVYDVWGSTTHYGSVTSAVQEWTGAQFPADKIVLGLAAYGHSFRVTPSNALVHSHLDTSAAVSGTTPPGPNDTDTNPTAVSGTYTFAELV
ncbi:unnamed protein product [Mycena citricolor]|uniref:GH18 domain-containing protein n=1 Tax=Mycena citricolor TaxID=2018698 RepID=A0AAD2HMI7_9AGAR|nr:unnamed protein product [Mycena citricolor]